jgi:hypothetical protein
LFVRIEHHHYHHRQAMTTLINDEEITVATVEEDGTTSKGGGVVAAKASVLARNTAAPSRSRYARWTTPLGLGAAGLVLLGLAIAAVVIVPMTGCTLRPNHHDSSTTGASSPAASFAVPRDPCDPNPCAVNQVCKVTNDKDTKVAAAAAGPLFLCQAIEEEEESEAVVLGKCPQGGSDIRVRRHDHEDGTAECLVRGDRSAVAVGVCKRPEHTEDPMSYPPYPCKLVDDTCVYLAEFNQVFCYAGDSPCAGNPCNSYSEYCRVLTNDKGGAPYECVYVGGLLDTMDAGLN